MGTIARTNPTPVNVHAMSGAGTLGSALASQQPVVTVRVPLSTAGGTGDAGMLKWINP